MPAPLAIGCGQTEDYDLEMGRRGDDFGNEASIAVVNPQCDTSLEAFSAWNADVTPDDCRRESKT